MSYMEKKLVAGIFPFLTMFPTLARTGSYVLFTFILSLQFKLSIWTSLQFCHFDKEFSMVILDKIVEEKNIICKKTFLSFPLMSYPTS